jgi:S1-C subfamily serine protease
MVFRGLFTGLSLATLLAAAAQSAAQDTNIAELFRRVDPAVVEISAVQYGAPHSGSSQGSSAGSLGSGFLISDDGLVVTAAHVVQVADEVNVRFVSGDVTTARVVASEPSMDVALIRVRQVPEGIGPVPLGDSDTAEVGDQVFVVGAPFGISHSLSVGYVSARRSAGLAYGGLERVELLQTDAAINQGNSGGPLFNMNGEAIGIVSHILSTSGGSQGLGFVVTANVARHVLLEDPTPWNGLDLLMLEGQLAHVLNLPRKAGLLVQGVATGSPGAALGLRGGNLPAQIGGQTLTLGGDVILAIHGIDVGDPDFREKVRERTRLLGPNDTVDLSVLREGDVIELSKTIAVLGLR